MGRLPVRFGASKRAVNYRAPCPLINRALPRGAFFDPMPRLEAPEALYSPAKRAIFFYWCPSGARPGQPARGAAAPRRGGSGGRLAGLLRFVLARPAPCPGRPLHRDIFLKPHHLQPILSMKRGRRQSTCTDCKKKKRRCTPDHLIEELPGEGESKDEEGEAEWKDDPLAPIRRLALPGLGAGIRDFATGSRHEKVRFLTSRKGTISITCCCSFCFRKRKQSEHHQRQQLQAC